MRRALVLTLLLICGLSIAAQAHVVAYELDKAPDGEVFARYLKLGFDHIIPKGLDHILFILCIFFLNTSLRRIILQATMFTLAHSITLGLAASGIIAPNPAIVEPLIALSIVLLALENVLTDRVRPRRLLMVFLFGLVHGMGFAGVLAELGIPDYAFVPALVAFNVGVELGQLSIITGMYLLVALPFAKRSWYRKAIVIPCSIVIGAIALFWTVQRTIEAFS